MKYLKSFLPKETLLDTIVLLISILPIEKRAFRLVKIMFFNCSFTKLYRFFIHLWKYFKKAFIIFIFYNILFFFSQIDNLLQIYGFTVANSANNTAIINTLNV